MPDYFIAQVKIRDRAGFAEYETEVGRTLTSFRGKMLVAEDFPETLEGTWPEGRTVVIEFDSAQLARAWFHSEPYQQIARIRRAHSDCAMAIVRGVGPQVGSDSSSPTK